MILFLAIILGAFIGTFLNMLTYRLPIGAPLVFDRSQCTKCKRPLPILSLIPLLSFLIQHGRCTMCGTPISWRYFFVELISAACAAVLVTHFGMTWDAVFWGLVVACCIAHFVIDCEHHILPHSISATLFILSLFHSITTDTISETALSVGVGMATLYGIRFIGTMIYKQEALGLGDVFFMGAIGLFLPLNHMLLLLYIAFVSGGLFGLVALFTGRKNRTDAVAFGPFLIIGFLATLFFGDPILNAIWG